MFSPRLGVVSKLTGDGRTVLRVSYGMFHQGLLTGEFAAIHPGATPTTTAAFDHATGGYTTLVKVDDPRINLQSIRRRRHRARRSTPLAWIARSVAGSQ